MNLESEVVSLRYAKRFKDAGIFQESSPLNWVEAAWTYEINTSLEKKVTETKTKLVFGDLRMITDRYGDWTAPTIGVLLDWLPQRITLLPDNANGGEGNPFNSFRLRIEKCLIEKDGEFQTHYVANYRCDSTGLAGEDAWIERTLFQHNVHDVKLADCLAELILQLIESEFIKCTTN